MEKNLVEFSATLPSLHNNRHFLFDVRYKKNNQAKPVLIFVHGFKGFKDWGHFNLWADYFGESEFVFCKLNLSHNGTTPEHPTEFIDLEAFGQNNFSKELDDIGTMIDYFYSSECEVPTEEMNRDTLFLLGHSRGGGMALLKTAEDDRIKAVATLSAMSDLEKRWSEDYLQKWEKEGIQYVFNGRTKQNMPLSFQLIENLRAHKDRLDIAEAVKKLKQPTLIVHGTKDETIPVSMAHELKDKNPSVTLLLIEGAGHTFGGYHPYPTQTLPVESLKAAEEITAFFKLSKSKG